MICRCGPLGMLFSDDGRCSLADQLLANVRSHPACGVVGVLKGRCPPRIDKGDHVVENVFGMRIGRIGKKGIDLSFGVSLAQNMFDRGLDIDRPGLALELTPRLLALQGLSRLPIDQGVKIDPGHLGDVEDGVDGIADQRVFPVDRPAA